MRPARIDRAARWLLFVIAACACERVEERSPDKPPEPTPTPIVPLDAEINVKRPVYCAEADPQTFLCHSSAEACRYLKPKACTEVPRVHWHCKRGGTGDSVVENCFPQRAMCMRAHVGAVDDEQSDCTRVDPVWCMDNDGFLLCYSTRAVCDAIRGRMQTVRPGEQRSCEPR